MAANGSGIAAGGYFYNYQRELQLGFVLIMKLRLLPGFVLRAGFTSGSST
jgi:hypothetical protein